MKDFPIIWSAQEAREHRLDAREQMRLATENLQNIQFAIEDAVANNEWSTQVILLEGTTTESMHTLMGYLKSKGYAITIEREGVLNIGWMHE